MNLTTERLTEIEDRTLYDYEQAPELACADVTALLAEVRALRQVAAWVPVSERLPQELEMGWSEAMLVVEDGHTLADLYNYNFFTKTWYERGSSRTSTRITHYRRLPAPPYAAQEGGEQE